MIDKRLGDLGFWIDGSTLRGKHIQNCQISLVTNGCKVVTPSGDTVVVPGIADTRIDHLVVSGGKTGIVLD